MKDVAATGRGLMVGKCFHCPGEHFVDWDETTLYPGVSYPMVMWSCPKTGEPTRTRIPVSVHLVAHALGATLITSLKWSGADDASLAGLAGRP